MDLSQFHFAEPLWFWTLIVIPLIWILFFLYYQKGQPRHQLEKFIDKHLIPYLLLKEDQKQEKLWPKLLFWSFVWSLFVIALAGPRWDFREVNTFTRDQNLVILLDLSESMNATDISPSRLGRAKQKVEDLLNMSKDVKVGLIAFAADPHMIAPMTDDKETIRHLLPSLDTDLVYVQGSKLSKALEMASTMLKNEPGNNKAIVVISDGGFEDASAIHTAKKLSEEGIILYTLGVGSITGTPLKDQNGLIIKKNGSPVISKLEKEKFQEISKIGHGRYFDANHSEKLALIFDDLEKKSEVQQKEHHTERLWDEHFYLFLLPVLPFFLFWFKRGHLFILIFIPSISNAALTDFFHNNEQNANQIFENGDYSIASQEFEDPYRKGVAYYRAGDYKTAEEMFQKSNRPEVASSAAYNLGNTLVQQNKLQEAITAYENVLEKWPDHQKAKENLELVKKMLQQQQQENQNQKSDNKQNNTKQDQKDSQSQNSKEPSKENQESSQNPNDKNEKNQSRQDSENKDQKNELEKKSSQENNKEKEAKQDSQPKKQTDAEKVKPEDQKNDLEKEASEKNHQEKQPSSPIEKKNSNQRSQEDLDADLWLDQIKNDPKSFLKNKFYLESKKNGTKEEIDPW